MESDGSTAALTRKLLTPGRHICSRCYGGQTHGLACTRMPDAQTVCCAMAGRQPTPAHATCILKLQYAADAYAATPRSTCAAGCRPGLRGNVARCLLRLLAAAPPLIPGLKHDERTYFRLSGATWCWRCSCQLRKRWPVAACKTTQSAARPVQQPQSCRAQCRWPLPPAVLQLWLLTAEARGCPVT